MGTTDTKLEGRVMEEKKKFNRSSWTIINWEFNIKWTVLMAWLVIIGFLIMGAFTYVTIWEKLLILPTMQPEHFAIIQRKILHLMIAEFLFGGLPVIIMAIILQLRILHRVSGPMHRLEKMVRQAAAGKLPKEPIFFRKNDIHVGLAEAFNSLISAIKSGAKFE
jgi:hypothetical protein